MLAGLIEVVRQREAGGTAPSEAAIRDPAELTRARVAPMVEGLFPVAERSVVLETLQRSVVFVAPETIHPILAGCSPLDATWDIANLYLDSIGAPLLGKKASRYVGISEDRTCYVSLRYFTHTETLADFIVHECAHVFHNCKRRTLGLPETRTREWLLEIEFRKRETFAYACEAYSRLLELGRDRAARAALVEDHAKGSLPNDETVDHAEYLDILREAIAVRNGWKRILARCASKPVSTRQALRNLNVAEISPG